MARFYGVIGFGSQVEQGPGVWVDLIVERSYFGDIIRNSRAFDDGSQVNANITISNTISIVADEYAFTHISGLRYVNWYGTLWTINSVEVNVPRLLLRLGEVYNGPTSS